jgi:hypothetical protein
MKEEYAKENEALRKQLEEQKNENAKLSLQILDFNKNLEGIQKKDQVINVT